jgi:dipeptide transport system permease protein
MIRVILTRILLVVPTFLGITLLAFFLAHAVPGDPIEVLAGEHSVSPERHAELMHAYGLDRPLWEQYLRYVGHVLEGDLGQSLVTHVPIVSEFLQLFPATVELSLAAMLFAVVIGIPAGTIAAVRRNSIFDQGVMGVSLAGYSMPIFWWGLLLIILFSSVLDLTPVSGRIAVQFDPERVTGFLLLDALIAGDWDAFRSAVSHLILPMVVLGTVPLAVVARMTRSSMLEVLGEDYIRTARAKGLAPSLVVGLHAMRNVLIPVITVIGLYVGSLFSGAILTETIFAWPGVGRWLVDAINRRDFTVLQAGVLLLGTVVMAVNVTVDVLYGFINPRIRHSG